MSHTLTTISTNRPLTKQYDPELKALSKAPNVPFRVSSQETKYDNLQELLPLLTEVANDKNVILVGRLKRKLEHESRAKKTLTVEPNCVLIIDVDKYEMDSSLPVDQLPQEFVNLLPLYFHNTSFIWQYSSSYHTTDNPHVLSGHLFFLLDKPMAPTMKKHFLTALNFIEPFNSQLTLSGTERNLHYPIDPVLAENSRIVYIAPPINLPDDVVAESHITKHNLEHIKLFTSEHHNPTLTIPATLSVEKIHQTKIARIKELRKERGYTDKSDKIFKTEYNQVHQANILVNPGIGGLELVDIDDTYIRMNYNGGDSNSYWAYRSNPEVVHCFKNDDAFYMKDVDPDFYQQIQERLQQEIQDAADDIIEKGGTTDDISKLGPMYQPDDNNMIIFGFYSKFGDSIHSCEYDIDKNIVRLYNHASLERLEMSLAGNHRPIPDTREMPNWNPVFDPTNPKLVNFKTNEINSFRPSELLHNYPKYADLCNDDNQLDPEQTIGYQDQDEAITHLSKLCPTIYFSLKNGAGCPPEDKSSFEFDHLLNWLAYTIQTRKKSERAWLLQGTSQSGKSSLINRILSPIFTSNHAQLLKFEQITDQFNAELEHLLFMGLDEVKAETQQHKTAMEGMKNVITEPEISIRVMRKNKRTIKSFTNFIFCTNYTDSFHLGTGEVSRFNICPFQRHSLPSVSQTAPHLYSLPPSTTYEEAMDQELPAFVSFIHKYEFDQFAATTAINNHAKQTMIDATRPFPSRFTNAVRDGDFSWFVENIPTIEELESHQLDSLSLQSKLKSLQHGIMVLNKITHQMPAAIEKVRSKQALAKSTGVSVSTKDLFILYTALTADQKPLSNKGFHTILKRNDLPYKQTTREGERGRFLDSYINWKIKPTDVALLKELTPPHVAHQPNMDIIAHAA